MRRVGRGRGALYLVRRSVLDAWIEAHPVDTSGASEIGDDEQGTGKPDPGPRRPRDEGR